MAKFALISGVDVVNVVVSDSEEGLGNMTELFDAVEISTNVVTPSRGWTYEGGTFYPPKISDAAKAVWNGSGFDSSLSIEASPE